MADTVVLNAEVKSNIGDVKEDAEGLLSDFQIMGVSLNSLQASFAKLGTVSKAAFGTMKAAMASTGILALVAAVASLVTYFTQTKRGAEALGVGMAGLKATFDVLIDRVIMFGEGLTKMLNPLTMREGLGMMRDAFKGIGAEIANDVKEATALEQAQQRLADSNRELNVEFAQRRSELERLKMIAEDTTKTEEERLAAAKQAFKIENDLLDKRVANAEEAVRIQKEQNALGESSAADLDALAEKEIALANIKQESTTKQIELNNKINSIQREGEAKRQAAIDEENRKLLEQKRITQELMDLETDRINELTVTGAQLLQEHYDRQLSAEDREKNAVYDKYFAIIEGKRALGEDVAELEEAQGAEIAAITKKYAKEEVKWSEMSDKQKLGIASSTAGNMATILGEETAAGQAFAITQATIDTFASAQGAYKSMASIPIVGPALGAVAAAAAVVGGMKNIQAIKGAGKGGGGGVSAGGGRGPTPPAPQMMSGEFNLSGGIAPEATRAYVVTDEMTDSQNQLANIRRRATI